MPKPKTVVTSIRLPEELHARLVEYCDRGGLKIGATVTSAVNDLLLRESGRSYGVDWAKRVGLEKEVALLREKVEQLDLIVNEEYSDLGYREGHGMRTYKQLAEENKALREQLAKETV